jgi:PIN domain nuclease of toxin-antitoxin system
MRLKYHARRPTRERKRSFEPNEVDAVLSGLRVTFLPMTIRHAARDLNAPTEHKDPFDELLVVQAQEGRLKVLTAD